MCSIGLGGPLSAQLVARGASDSTSFGTADVDVWDKIVSRIEFPYTDTFFYFFFVLTYILQPKQYVCCAVDRFPAAVTRICVAEEHLLRFSNSFFFLTRCGYCIPHSDQSRLFALHCFQRSSLGSVFHFCVLYTTIVNKFVDWPQSVIAVHYSG
jgi:hypothetical protein